MAEQKTTLRSIPVSYKDESEAKVGAGCLKLDS